MQTTSVRPPLVRRAEDRWMAGVAGGLADHTGTSVLWWRVGFVVAALAGGLGVVVYGLLWILIPRADLPRSAGGRLSDRFPDAAAWLGVGLLALGAFMLAGQLGVWSPSIGWGLLLIGLGIVLYRRSMDERGPTDGRGAPAPTSATTAVVGAGAPPATASDDPTEEVTWPEPPAPWTAAAAATPRRRRERSWLGWLSFGLALAVGGVLWLLRDSGTISISLGDVLAWPLAILGVGLVVGAFAGRALWTVLPALALAPFVMIGAIVPVSPVGRYASRTVAPQSVDALRPSYSQAGGELGFDLRFLPADAGRSEPIEAEVGLGSIDVTVPRDTPLVVTAHVGAGALDLGSQPEHGGFAQDGRFVIPGPDPIRMNLEVGIGEVDVHVVQKRVVLK